MKNKEEIYIGGIMSVAFIVATVFIIIKLIKIKYG